MAHAQTTSAEHCTWCGNPVDREEGFRLEEEPGERHAVFCRLEHVVPWSLQGAHWEPGALCEPSDIEESLTACAQCGEALGDVHVVLVRHRGGQRIPDGFCWGAHRAAWARRGG